VILRKLSFGAEQFPLMVIHSKGDQVENLSQAIPVRKTLRFSDKYYLFFLNHI